MQILDVIQRFDLRLFYRLFRHSQRPAIATAARALSRSGDGLLHLLLPLLLIALQVPGVETFCLALALAMALERSSYWVLKNGLRRRRPQDFVPGLRSVIQASDKFSFPSGHSSAAFCLATCALLVFGGPVAVMLVWSASVAVSRVILGVHYPGDIVAGAVLGSLIAFSTCAWLGVA